MSSRAVIPLWLKVVYTAFMAVLVPYYWWAYTPWNFLYFCDVALFLTLAGLWREDRVLLGMAAVGILVPQMLWCVDFASRLLFGTHVTGMTAYMYDPALPLFVRGLSSFHGWLPFLLLGLVARVGYDRRALAAQSLLAVAVLLVSYLLAPAPPPAVDNPTAAVNINYVYGFDDTKPQEWVHPHLWFLAMTAVVLALYVPAHVLLQRLFGESRVRGAAFPGTAAAAPGTRGLASERIFPGGDDSEVPTR